MAETSFDEYGRPEAIVGPYYVSPGFTTSETQKVKRYIGYDSLGRQRIVARQPFVGSEVQGAVVAFAYHDFDSASPSSPASIESFTFSVPRDYTDPAIPVDSDVRRSTTFIDGMGREIQVRERLGGTGAGSDPSIAQHLSNYRVTKALVLDGAGRVTAAVEPFFAYGAQFVDFRASSLDKLDASATVLATFTAYDDQGRTACETRRDFTSGAPAAGVCSSNFTSTGYALARRFVYRGATVSNRGYLAVKTIPPENNVGSTPAGSETFYDAAGWERWTTDAEGNTTRLLYDLLGRGRGFSREVLGNAKTPVASTIELDMMGRVSKRIDPNTGTRKFEYFPDKPGLLQSAIFEKTLDVEKRLDEIQYDYDRGRIKSVKQCRYTSGIETCADDAVFTYDRPVNSSDESMYAYTAGRVATAVNGNTSIWFGYDENGAVVLRDQWVAGEASAFSTMGAVRQDGRVTQNSFTGPSGIAYAYTTSYDSMARPVEITGGGVTHWSATNAPANTGAYDPLGRLGTVALDGGAVRQSWSFQAYSGMLGAQSVAFTAGGPSVYAVDTMTYQGAKLKSYRDALTQTEHAYWYSAAGRLTAARTRPVGATTTTTLQCLGYSTTNTFGTGPSFGNIELVRTSGTTIDHVYSGMSVNLTPPAGPDAVTAIGATLVDYDDYGRVAAAGGGTETYGYDLQNRLTSIVRSGGPSETLAYGPFGELVTRRIGTAVTHYVGLQATVTGTVSSCGQALCAIDSSTMKVDVHMLVGGERVGSVRKGSGAPTRTMYLHRDRLGSVVATTLNGGRTGASYRYAVEGAVEAAGDVGEAASELGYTGGLRLSGGLVLLGVRVYNPALRAFMQPDPLAPFTQTYVGGDPINWIDPTGMTGQDAGGAPQQCNGDCSAGWASSRGWSSGYATVYWVNLPTFLTFAADGSFALPAGLFDIQVDFRGKQGGQDVFWSEESYNVRGGFSALARRGSGAPSTRYPAQTRTFSTVFRSQFRWNMTQNYRHLTRGVGGAIRTVGSLVTSWQVASITHRLGPLSALLVTAQEVLAPTLGSDIIVSLAWSDAVVVGTVNAGVSAIGLAGGVTIGSALDAAHHAAFASTFDAIYGGLANSNPNIR